MPGAEKRPLRLASALVFLLLASQAASGLDGGEPFSERPVRLVADDWCPQHCESGTPHKGYIVDIVERALRLEKVPYVIEYRPWGRALAETQRGSFDGLLTPTVAEYPQFLFPREAVGYQEYCLYVRKDDPWKYVRPEDLLDRRVAFLKDSGLGELETFFERNARRTPIQQFSDGKGYTSRIFSFLARKRTDVVIITSDVYHFNLKSGIIANNFRQAGCLGAERLAVGLSQANPERSKRLAVILDQGIRQLRQSGELKKITDNYGIADW